MKCIKIISIVLVSFMFQSINAETLPSTNHLVAKNNYTAKTNRSTASTKNSWIRVKRLLKSKNYSQASVLLNKMSVSSKYRKQKSKINYMIGLSLFKMKLYQTAAFYFIKVIKSKNKKYLNLALDKLALAADILGDEAMLNYAVGKVNIKTFPKKHKDMLFYRIGEFQSRNRNYRDAINSLSRVSPRSSFYGKAKYLQALSYAESKSNGKALRAFDDLLENRSDRKVTNTDRVAAILGKARVYYQAKKWDEAIEYYRQVPVDTTFWHETLFESSWAMLRGEKFRSALSNFQSLHSPYYESFYLPESLILRSIIYLFICKYEEMEKVLNLFMKIYQPVYKSLRTYLSESRSYSDFHGDLLSVTRLYDKDPTSPQLRKTKIPLVLARKISKEGDFSRNYRYIKRLIIEKKRIKAKPSSWRSSPVGKYATKVIDTRISKARKKSGKIIRSHMIDLKAELFDLIEQESFVRYEMINSKKEVIKKKVAGKNLTKKSSKQKRSRSFYVKNGYEYWPFQGEYWLDELGNYHYVGTHSCGK